MKIGYVHIPKCAGSALSWAIHESLGLRRVHISAMSDQPSENDPHQLVWGSLAFAFARNSPFISGHTSYSEMKRLDRDFIFTVLRDPRERLFSWFTYNRARAMDPQVIERHPELIKRRDQCFVEALNDAVDINPLATRLLKDRMNPEDLRRMAEDQAHDESTLEQKRSVIRNALKRFDQVYCGPDLQDVLDRLVGDAGIPPTLANVRNTSEKQPSYEIGCSHTEFCEVVDRYTWMDCLLYREAARVFKHNPFAPLKSMDEFVHRITTRFDLAL